MEDYNLSLLAKADTGTCNPLKQILAALRNILAVKQHQQARTRMK